MNEHDVLERALERMGSSAVELDEVYRLRDRRRLRRRVAAGSTAIAIVILSVGLFVRSLDQASHVTPGGASTSPTVTGGADAVVYDAFPSWVQLRAIAGNATGYVAVGDVSDGDSTDPVWFSPDGTTWTRAPNSTGPRSPNLWDVIANQQGFVAVGLDQHYAAAAWYSTDGLTWASAPVEAAPGDMAMFGVVQIADRYYTWGWSVTNGAFVWTSPDGRSWSALPDESIFVTTYKETKGIYGAVGQILWMGQDAAGLFYAGGEDKGNPALWRSRDGITWDQIPVSSEELQQLRQDLQIRDRTTATNDLGKAHVGFGDAGSSITFTPVA